MDSSPSLVVVTGAAGALGHAVAEAFATQGARLLRLDRSRDMLASRALTTSDVIDLAVDLSDAKATSAALGPLLADLGPPTVLCNIAGGFSMGALVHEQADANWRHMMDLNVGTLINASRVVVPAMRQARAGKVINVAAAGASTGKAAMGAYCAAKSAVARLTESMSLELRAEGINVNAVAPSILDTPANRAAMPDADFTQWVSTAAMADVVTFLASDAARAIHGAVIPVVGLS